MKVLPFKIPITKGESFRVQLDDEPYFYDTLHKHGELQIMYIQEGEGTVICGDYIGNFYPGDLFVIGPDQPHVFRSNKEHYEKGSGLRARAISLYFDRTSFGLPFFELPELSDLSSFMDRSLRGIQFGKHTSDKIVPAISTIESSKGLERFITLLEILESLVAAQEYTYLSSLADKSQFDEKEGKRMSRIYEYAMRESYRTITLEEISEVANMTPNAFCRYFKQRTRKTFVNFLIEIRIANVCKLLRDKELTIAEIGYQCGFNNLSHFNRKFKSLKGMSPKDYQKKVLAIN